MITLDPVQEEGAQWIVDTNGTGILGDTMGVGKTYTAIAGVCRVARWPVLCIVANSVRHVWANHFRDWDPTIDVKVFEGRTPWRLEWPPDVAVINFAILDSWKDTLLALPWAQIVIDEAHKCGGHDTASYKAVKKLCDRVRGNGGGMLLLSGTPYTNNTCDAWKLFNLIDPTLFPSRDKFERIYDAENYVKRKCLVGAFVRRRSRQDAMREFAILKASGQISRTTPEQLDELKRKIAPYLLRRTESAAWKPAPEEDTEFDVALTEDEIAAVDPNLPPADWQKGRRRSIDFDDGQLCHALAVIAEAKAPYCAQWVKAWTAANPTGKLVVAYKHKAMRNAIYNEVRKICVIIDGSYAAKVEAERKFQNEVWARVALVHVSASALGITLHAAAEMFFAESPWTASDRDQARARINRRGQVAAVCKYTTCTATGTLDEIVGHIVRRKAQLAHRLLSKMEE